MPDIIKRLQRVKGLVIDKAIGFVDALAVGRRHGDDLDALRDVLGVVAQPPRSFTGPLMPDAISSIGRSKAASAGSSSRDGRH